MKYPRRNFDPVTSSKISDERINSRNEVSQGHFFRLTVRITTFAWFGWSIDKPVLCTFFTRERYRSWRKIKKETSDEIEDAHRIGVNINADRPKPVLECCTCTRDDRVSVPVIFQLVFFRWKVSKRRRVNRHGRRNEARVCGDACM